MVRPPHPDPNLSALPDLDGAFAHAAPQERLAHARRGARTLRARLLAAPPVTFYRTVDLVRVPYPTRFALRAACTSPVPYVHLQNRMIVVQLPGPDGPLTLLIGPSDVQANQATPYLRRLARKARLLGRRGEALLAPRESTVEAGLGEIGLRPEDVGYITFDHLHTQDLRRWLGTSDTPAYFPRAKLLVTRQEWISAHALLPPQAEWYCPGGLAGVSDDRVALLDGGALLGESVALVPTPGHTLGNHSIAVHTPEGVLVTSENGVCADAYAPLRSAIPGLRAHAMATGEEVVLNGNTMEGGLDQYVSMILEAELAGPSARNPDFPGVVPSSELVSWWMAPGIEPTFSHGSLCLGCPAR